MATLLPADPATDRPVAELCRVEGKVEPVKGRGPKLPTGGLVPGAVAQPSVA